MRRRSRNPRPRRASDPATTSARAIPAAPEPPLPFDAPAFDELPWLDDEPALDHGTHRARRCPGDIHTLDWDALAERVAACERCRLCENRTNTVFGVGDREADWMLIGEAPGENEDSRASRSSARPASCSTTCCVRVTLARDINVYIANVIKCRPPGNRNPEPDEVARCEPYLQRQVALVKPKLIVALGRFAAQSLLKTDASIASLRGRVHRIRGRAGDRHVSPGVSAAQPARQGEGVGRPVPRARHVARERRAAPAKSRRAAADGAGAPSSGTVLVDALRYATSAGRARSRVAAVLAPICCARNHRGRRSPIRSNVASERAATHRLAAPRSTRDPAPLHRDARATRKSRVSAFYAESLLEWFLQHGPAARTRRGERAVAARQRRTIGECDFLVQTRAAARVCIGNWR